jgi:Holliday junction resolvase-like predicted endonuclease
MVPVVETKQGKNMDTVTILSQILSDAQSAAQSAATKYYAETGSKNWWPCGFAWVQVSEKGNTKLGRALLASGLFRKAYGGGLQWWNPSGMMVQNMDTLRRGADAAAEVLRDHGINAYASCRMD